jgi:hypothetical protein
MDVGAAGNNDVANARKNDSASHIFRFGWLALGQVVVVLMIGFLSWLLVAYLDMGLYGIALGAAIPIFLFAVTFQPIYACRQVRLKWTTFLTRTYGRVLLCTVPSAVVGVILLASIYPKGLLMICIEGLVCVMVFAVCAWWFALSRQERQDIRSILSRDRSQARTRNDALSQEMMD